MNLTTVHRQDPPPVASGTDGEPGLARGAVAIITNAQSHLLLHLRDDLPGVVWPGHWSLLGGGCDPGEPPTAAIVRELQEEAGLTVDELTELFTVRDEHGSGQLITFFAGRWQGDESQLRLSEGVRLEFIAPARLPDLTIPPYIRAAIYRHLGTRPA